MRENNIEDQEIEYYLDILIESDLYKNIQLIREARFPNEKEMIKKSIDKFIKSLPKKYYKINNLMDYIIKKLSEVDKETQKSKKETKIQEQEER